MSAAPAPLAAWILSAPDAPDLQVWGLTPVERLRRSLERAGCAPVKRLAPDETPLATGRVLIARGDWIYDERLIEALASETEAGLLAPEGDACVAASVPAERAAAALEGLRAGRALPGVDARHAAELTPAWTPKLRKAEPPYLLAARPEAADEIERHTFSASYKGATDLVTKWVWPAPARVVTRRLAVAGVHPNTVTLASWGLAIAAFFLFSNGQYGWGLVTAWLMTFLDTVDGKLARVTLTSSRVGDVMDHGLDLVHPPFWWWAWGAGVGWAAHPATWVAVGGYFVGRALEGAFLAAFRFETHSWRPLDVMFRTITARRNPNLLLLSVGAAGGRPDLGMVMVAIWTALSLGFHAVRLLQALAARARGLPVEPWDGPPAAATG